MLEDKIFGKVFSSNFSQINFRKSHKIWKEFTEWFRKYYKKYKVEGLVAHSPGRVKQGDSPSRQKNDGCFSQQNVRWFLS